MLWILLLILDKFDYLLVDQLLLGFIRILHICVLFVVLVRLHVILAFKFVLPGHAWTDELMPSLSGFWRLCCIPHEVVDLDHYLVLGWISLDLIGINNLIGIKLINLI